MNRDFLDAVSESVRISQQKWIEWQHERNHSLRSMLGSA